MTFFYDLNKRLANLGQQQTLSESAVAEASYSAKAARAGKDIGKPGKNFEKIAKSAGERYGSKAAGERVAGAVLNKLRHPKESMEEGQLNELSPELLKRASDAAGMKWAHADDRRDKKASEKYSAQNDKFHSAMRKKQKDMDEAAVRIMAKPEGSQVTRGTAAYVPKNSPAGQTPQGQAHRDATAAMAKSARAAGGKLAIDKTTDTTGTTGPSTRDALAKGVTPFRSSMEEEGGIPMTAKQKSFAALAPPKDKITFADKIAGAKQEVEEMLGDVAAEAIKSALSPKQKKLDRNNNGRLDAQDFEMLRKGAKQETDEGFPTVAGARAELNKRKVGDITHGAKHDTEETPTGRRVTRRTDAQGYSVGSETDDEGNAKSTEKRKAGRPKGADKGPERVTSKAYKHKGGRVKEDGMEDMIEPHDSGEYDREGEMAKDSIKTVVRHAQALEKILGDNDNLPEWVQSKLAKIESMMTAVDDYMQNQEDGDEMPMGEESTTKRDNRAEKAGKKVTKDIEYDEKKKEKKVAETTTSGSVATGGDAPKAGKGGMQIGKGIYDSLNRKVEGMIAESMSINVSMTNDDNGSHKNITVTASDEDAEMLAQLLARAGLTGGGTSHGHEEPCPDCGSTDCGCDEAVEEAYGDTNASQNKPDWPTDTEYSDDAMQYSGGLNKPKTDVAGNGQTTVPVTAVHTQDEDALRRMMEMAGIKQQELKPWERTMKEATSPIDFDKVLDAIAALYGDDIWDNDAMQDLAHDLEQAGPTDRELDFIIANGKLPKRLANTQFSAGDDVQFGEGVVDKVKDVVKKGLEKLGHGSDEDLRKDLQKKMGLPQTGEKPKDGEKMQESLMKEFANFKI